MDMKLVGRIREQELLTDALTSYRSELVAIYGRRRIGKTVRLKSVTELRGGYLLVDQLVVFTCNAVTFKTGLYLLHACLHDIPPLSLVAVVEGKNLVGQDLIEVI
jgi:AAA+ ATPase superfamily predicted ATPase